MASGLLVLFGVKASIATWMLGAVLAGCAPMFGPDAMLGVVGEVIAEDGRHLTAARSANSLASLVDDVDRHVARVHATMDDMRSNMNALQQCTEIEALRTLRDEMDSEADAHAEAMHAETDLAEAQAEVEAHVGTMGEMLGDMGTLLDGTRCRGW